RKNARLRFLQNGFIDVGRVDAAAVVETLLVKEDRHRVDLFARRTSGVPDADEWIRAEQRDHFLPECEVESRIAKHRGRVDGEIEEEALHARGIVQHL